jgi:hypothetical protein
MLNEKIHGVFFTTATLSQNIKDVLRSGKNWTALTDPQAEVLESISTILARILSGDKDNRLHWDELAEYARLASATTPSTMPNVTFDLASAMSGSSNE